MIWRHALETLETWSNERGYFVNFEKSGDTCICHLSKIIEINSSFSEEIQTYLLLHECGHALIFEYEGTFNYSKFRNDENADNHKIFRLIEEVEAWKRGFTLAKKLKIKINEEKWENEIKDAIEKYAKWSVK